MSDIDSGRPLREVVAGQLRSMILSGELKPGQRLVEGHLAQRLGVSRNPVREGMRSLEATGLIEVVPRRGAHVCAIDKCKIHHLQQIRILVEGYAAAQAALRQDPQGMQRLRRCMFDGRRAIEAGDEATVARCQREFHVALVQAASIPILQQVLDPLRQQSELMFSVVDLDDGAHVWSEHEAIYEAVVAGNAEHATELSRQHILNALESFSRAVEAASLDAEPRLSA